MAKAKVYCVRLPDRASVDVLAEAAATLARAAFRGVVVEKRPCAIKQHFGEGSNDGYLKPEIARVMVEFVRAQGGLPFLTDTNTLYRGRRSNAVGHLAQAADNGFTHERLGAPVIIADGLLGAEQVTVPIEGGKHFKDVRIAAAAYHAASAIVLTHVKGHCQVGLGGSIKNVGMGFAARAGKLAQHHGGLPEFKSEKCTACGTCARWCPAHAIRLQPKATLLGERCIGCGECFALCPADAIGFRWSEDGPVLIERICEHALGFLSNKRGHVGYVNFVHHLTKDCDCLDKKQKPEYPDVAVLAGTDMVAVDKAAADLAIERAGKDIWSAWWPKSDYTSFFTYGERIGLGTARYELVIL
jgi:uncharacterized Fe-S center protein